MARFWHALSRREGIGAAALRFQMLTATRSGAIRFMTWDEIDFENRVWVVQPGRKSSKIDHRDVPKRTPLTEPMVNLLQSLPRQPGSDIVFWAPRGGTMSDATIAKVMRTIHEREVAEGCSGFIDAKTAQPAVPHGTRSTFKVWATEQTSYDWNLSEAALWHKLGTKVERAYARTDMLEKRRDLMLDWGAFISNAG